MSAPELVAYLRALASWVEANPVVAPPGVGFTVEIRIHLREATTREERLEALRSLGDAAMSRTDDSFFTFTRSFGSDDELTARARIVMFVPAETLLVRHESVPADAASALAAIGVEL